MATQPVRIDRDLFDEATHTGAVMGRSAAAQIEHWARLGRAVEALPDLPHGVITQLLSEPAELSPRTDEQHAEHLAALLSDGRTTADAFEGSTHRSLVGTDEQGEPVERQLEDAPGVADVAVILARASSEPALPHEVVQSLFDHWLAGLELFERVDDLPGGRENLHRHLLRGRPTVDHERTRSDA